jgi:hypothetical protein
VRRLLTIAALIFASLLVLGACSDDDGDTADESSSASGTSDDSTPAADADGGEASGDFCPVVEENLEMATGSDLLAALDAIETMAAAAPDDLQQAFEENIATFEPVRGASSAEEANEIFVDEVITEPGYEDSFLAVEAGVEEECGINISDAAS